VRPKAASLYFVIARYQETVFTSDNHYAQWQAVPAEDRSDAPAWWWDTALAAIDETATMPVEWCATLGVADESTYAKGAEVFRNALVGQTYLPQSENFPRKS